jgi:thioredoxin-like negative regulator of GroEL
MTTMLCAAMIQSAILLTGADKPAPTPETYAEAYRTTEKTGKPMVVMVSTEWCAPCQTMKRRIMPRVRERAVFRRVSFAMVNPDQDTELAEQITGGGPIPQLVMYRKTANGWMRRKLIGGQSVEDVETFLKEGLADDAAEKKTEAKAKEASKAEAKQAETKQADAKQPQPQKGAQQS